MKNKPNLLVAAGALLIGISQVINHFFDFSDMINGVLMGLGLGFMAAALLVDRKKEKA